MTTPLALLRRPAARWLAVYAVFAALVFRAALVLGDGGWPGHDGDAKIVVWYLRWFPWAVAHGHNPLVTDHLQHPGGVNLLWNASVLLLAAVMSPVTTVAGPVLAYDLLVVGGVALSALCAHLALRRLGGSDLAAGLGGAAYGFSPFMMANATGHLHVGFAPFPPLLLLLLDGLLRRSAPARSTGLWLGLAVALQLLIGEELLLLSILGALVGLVVLAVQHPSRVGETIPRLVLAAAVAAAVAAVLAGPLLAFQLFGPGHPQGAVLPSGGLVTDLEGLVVPSRLVAVAPPPIAEHTADFALTVEDVNAYVGLPLLVIGLVWLRRGLRDPRVRFGAATGVLLLVLSLGPTLHRGGRDTGIPLPWGPVGRLPFLEDAAPGRLMGLVFLMLALLVAVAAERLTLHPPGKARLLGWTALAAALVPMTPTYDFPSTSDATPAFFTSAAAAWIPDGSVVLVTPFANSWGSHAMLWQARAGMRFRMPEGTALGRDASLDGPRSRLEDLLVDVDDRGRELPALTPDLRSALAGELGQWGVGTVVVGPSPNRAAVERLFEELLADPPERLGGVTVWWSVRPAPA